MSALSSAHNAVNLSQGFPDFDCQDRLKSLVTEHMSRGYNQYAPMAGLLDLREQIALKYERWHDHAYHPESEVTVTAGATQALFTAITAFVHPGDEVVVVEPAYDCYAPAITLIGAKVVPVAMDMIARDLDVSKIKSAITDKTRLLIINSPHNPTGIVVSHDQMKALENLLKGTDIIILSDEVYEHMVFDEGEHCSIAKYPSLRERGLLISSFGKTYHNTGWKLGYCCGPTELMDEFRKVHQFNVFCVNRPMQHALADFMKIDDSALALNAFYAKKRDFFCEAISSSRFQFTPTEGTYFQLLDYSQISKEADTDVAEKWTEEYGIASIPISVFYKKPPVQHLLRFCFAKGEETLLKGAEILNSI